MLISNNSNTIALLERIKAKVPAKRVDGTDMRPKVDPSERPKRIVVPNLRRGVKTYEYKGQTYTIRQLSQLPECKMTVNALRQRLKRMSVEDAVNQPKIEHFVSNITPPERYEYCSESLTLLQLCKRAGVSKGMIYERMKRGLTVDEALATSTQHGNEGYVVEFKWRDQVYTIREYCKVTGIPISRAIIEVVNNGLTGDQCAELINKRYIHYEFEGELYTVKQLAEKVGCSPTMLRYRVDVLKWPVAKAVEYGWRTR